MQYPLRQCCCGCSLTTGAKIIGWVTLATGMAMVAEGIWMVRGFDRFRASSSTVVQPTAKEPCCSKWMLDVAGFVTLTLGILLVVTSSSLLVGIKQRRPGMVMQWAVTVVVVRIMFSALIPLSLVVYFKYHETQPLYLVAAPGAIQIGLDVYYLMVMHSYYRLLIEQEAPPQTVSFVP